MTKRSPVWPPKPFQIDSETGAASQSFAKDYGFIGARDLLLNGGLVALPTETVYGLAADATNARAVSKIFAAKERPSFNPLISHVASLEAAMMHGVFNAQARRLAEAFWPGPLTLVVPKRQESAICDLTTAGLDTVALRVPDAPLMRALSFALGRPLAAPSANRSGRVSPTTAAHVREELAGRVDLIADLGSCPVGVESSVIYCADHARITLLRPGGLATDEIEAVLGKTLERAGSDDQTPSSPGMLTSHYAPSAQVRLNAGNVRKGEALLAFGPDLPEGAEDAVQIINLSQIGDTFHAARQLFAALRTLDRDDVNSIAVMPIPDDGLGEAINDRLNRAAAGRKAAVDSQTL